MNGRKNKRAKACDIPAAVKRRVWERDGPMCIICNRREGAPNSHYLRRSHGGLGIEENIVTMCYECHHMYDNGTTKQRQAIGSTIRFYLQHFYPDWDESKLVYHKYGG